MKKNITCIICPRGCAITAEIDNGNIKIIGNGCKRGEEYANNECTNPTRTVTSSVVVSNREDTMVSVKTVNPIPKDKIFDIMKEIRLKKAVAPVKTGDIIIKDIYGTNVVATKNIN